MKKIIKRMYFIQIIIVIITNILACFFAYLDYLLNFSFKYRVIILSIIMVIYIAVYFFMNKYLKRYFHKKNRLYILNIMNYILAYYIPAQHEIDICVFLVYITFVNIFHIIKGIYVYKKYLSNIDLPQESNDKW